MSTSVASGTLPLLPLRVDGCGHTPTAWNPPSTCTISPVVAGNQSESRATTALPAGSVSVTDQPSGARDSHASSNCLLPGIDFIAMLRSGPAATMLDRTPSGPSSRATYRLVDSSAALAAPIQPYTGQA